MSGRPNGKRKVERVFGDTVILTDTVHNKNRVVTKKKLVHIYPRLLYWTNTYIGGQYKYSQFPYQIVPEGKSACRLEFTGLQIMYGNEKRSRLASKLRKEDSKTWKLLARAM